MKFCASRLLSAGFGVCLAALPVLAHHSFAAQYDEKKPLTLKGIASRYAWTNPHVYLEVDVQEGAKTTTWLVEYASVLDLKKNGWTRDTVKVGDSVTVEGYRSRAGGEEAGGKSLQVAGGKKLMSPTEAGPVIQTKSQGSKPTPRWPNGHPRLGPEPGQSGYWSNPSAGSLVENSAGNIRMNRDGLLANIEDAGKVAPFQPWAKALYEYRQRNMLKDDPMAYCLPPAGPRQFQAQNGFQILEQPDRGRMFVVSGGGNRNWRLIYLDGRPLPTSDDATPTYFGYSGGKWEGDTLVINSVGFVERFWFANGGLPHTEALKLTEKISRPDFNTLKYEVTVDDVGAYTRPWTGGWTMQWIPNEDPPEYFCDEYNLLSEKISGKHHK